MPYIPVNSRLLYGNRISWSSESAVSCESAVSAVSCESAVSSVSAVSCESAVLCLLCPVSLLCLQVQPLYLHAICR